jgi:hypothetical protein
MERDGWNHVRKSGSPEVRKSFRSHLLPVQGIGEDGHETSELADSLAGAIPNELRTSAYASPGTDVPVLLPKRSASMPM